MYCFTASSRCYWLTDVEANYVWCGLRYVGEGRVQTLCLRVKGSYWADRFLGLPWADRIIGVCLVCRVLYYSWDIYILSWSYVSVLTEGRVGVSTAVYILLCITYTSVGYSTDVYRYLVYAKWALYTTSVWQVTVGMCECLLVGIFLLIH